MYWLKLGWFREILLWGLMGLVRREVCVGWVKVGLVRREVCMGFNGISSREVFVKVRVGLMSLV